MTDSQIAAILGVLAAGGTAVVAFLKWCLTQWKEQRQIDREDRKAEMAAREADRKLERDDRIATIGAMTAMTVKFEAVTKQLDAVEWSVDEISEVRQQSSYQTPPGPQQRALTIPSTEHRRTRRVSRRLK